VCMPISAMEQFILNKDATIKEAMGMINTNCRGSIVVVDDQQRLVGVLSDGDIRRSLVKGTSMHSSIENVLNLNPEYVEEFSDIQSEAKSIFSTNAAINILPVVDKNMFVKEVIIR